MRATRIAMVAALGVLPVLMETPLQGKVKFESLDGTDLARLSTAAALGGDAVAEATGFAASAGDLGLEAALRELSRDLYLLGEAPVTATRATRSRGRSAGTGWSGWWSRARTGPSMC